MKAASEFGSIQHLRSFPHAIIFQREIFRFYLLARQFLKPQVTILGENFPTMRIRHPALSDRFSIL
jgi:hypothetical protein